MNQSVMTWYGHMERLSEERLVKRICRAEVELMSGRGRPQTRWRDGVRKMLGEKVITIQQAESCMKDRKMEECMEDKCLPL